MNTAAISTDAKLSVTRRSRYVAAVDNAFGPLIREDGVTFQLWAPSAASVDLRIGDGELLHMERDEVGRWRRHVACSASTRYQFVVDGANVPDPASRFQPDDVQGASQVIDATAFQWRHETWRGRKWEEIVFYELHVGVLGGYKGVAACLPALAELGITAIELMPIGDFAGRRNWGYDGVLPFAPDSSYGTPDELRSLIDQAHGHGIAVFLDVVYNHFGPEGNFLPAYAADFFVRDSHTPWGSAIDFGNPEVSRFFVENALYWLEEFRFDGLRLDAVHAIQNRDWLLHLAAELRQQITGRYIHLVVENENNDSALLEAGFSAQWNDDFHNVMHVLLTGERHAYYQDFADDAGTKLARCLREGFIYQGEASPNHGGKPRGSTSGHLRPSQFVAFLQNHDQVGNRAQGERLTALAEPRALRAAMALLLLSPQIPLLFMGEEAGAREPFLFFTDFHGELGANVREGRRKEFAKTPGFTDPDQQASIPDPNEAATFRNSAWTASAPDAADWRRLIHDLLELRRTEIIPYLADVKSIEASAVGPACVLASWQLTDGRVLTVMSNFGAKAVQGHMPELAPIYGRATGGYEIDAYTTIVWIKK